MSGWVRPSIGTLGVLGLKNVKMDALPTTAYIMLGNRCRSNCSFCTQRRENERNDRLSRVIWPEYDEKRLIRALRERKSFARICLQTLDYEGMVEDSIRMAGALSGMYPISVSMVPADEEDMLRLRDAGVEYLSIALDAANPELFRKIKGAGTGNRFTWETHWNALETSVNVFGKGNTHLIVGMGESDRDLIDAMLRLKEMGISTALFAYTPVNGGSPPDIGRYRAIQMSRALIYHHGISHFTFENGKLTGIGAEESIIEKAGRTAFTTSGCPGCNRPFYNERPGTELFNYPHAPDESIIKNGIERVMDYL